MIVAPPSSSGRCLAPLLRAVTLGAPAFLLLSLLVATEAKARSGYGGPCSSGGKECETGLCVKVAGGAFCTLACDEKQPCPARDVCVELLSEPAVANPPRFCLPKAATVGPCTSCVESAAKVKRAVPVKKAEPKAATKSEKAERVILGGGPVRCLVRSIHGYGPQASSPPGPPQNIDSRLSSLQKQLSRPPFAGFKTLKLLQTKEVELPEAGSLDLTLPSGKSLNLSFKERVQKRVGADPMLRMRLSISVPKTVPKDRRFVTTFTIANKGTLLVAGDRYRGGTLVVGITCENK